MLKDWGMDYKSYICSMQNKRHILILTIIGAFVILLIMFVQIFWVREAMNISHSQFEGTVNIALREVAEKIAAQKKATFQYENPVKKINDSYYIVKVNSEIDAEFLDYYIASTFKYFNIEQDVEYAIYDCSSDQMVYCNYISNKGNKIVTETNAHLPKFKEFQYYFSVSFPNYSITSLHNVPMWLVTSIIFSVALLFFVYALFIIYRQRNISIVQKDFINNMTHEFKTPLSTISIIQQVISDPEIVKEPQRLVNYANIIGVETRRMNEQVEKVLSIAKLEKGQFNLELEEINLDEILNIVVEQALTKNELDQKIEIDKEYLATNMVFIADRVHFTNIIFNLMDNAQKYGGKPCKIKLKTYNKNHSLYLEISDNGIGLNKKDQARIFDKFYRVPTGNVHNVKGFGLGLYYVKKIIEAHKFNINVDSTEGQGSCFTVTIPQSK
jgi:two-component system, OmpR family, phosphate regulon sensor histidine kinase PhoR